ncbi:MAG: DUF2075 domain-containing protein [Peptostreptococcaceae bacterium]|nr:DUF2075 domain-containing protein [Peptostreptococcaceae bacterium]
MAIIESTKFDEKASKKVSELTYGSKWPVVYVINNHEEAYIGETVDATRRTEQHLQNKEKSSLDNISIISDDTFNKSVIQDLEAFLIKYMSADGKYKLQNGNNGISIHNYYNRDYYEKGFTGIWEQLKNNDLVVNDLDIIENSDLFKYSPYKELTYDQYKVVENIIVKLAEGREEGKGNTFMINGCAGTGKTVLAVYLMKFLTEAKEHVISYEEIDDPGVKYINEASNKLGELKIGLVIPQQSLRKTLKSVFNNIRGLSADMIISPLQVPNDSYDLLIVDEAHRLRQRRALSQYPAFDKNNNKLGLDKSGTELDWILMCSKSQLFFYDAFQSVKPSDINRKEFYKLINSGNYWNYELTSQLRCEAGDYYIDYIKNIFSDNPPEKKRSFESYDLKMFKDVNEMVIAIKEKENDYGLCRVVAGYSWKWVTNPTYTKKHPSNKQDHDIEIDGNKYIWNTTNVDWVNSENSINEIGCIHTVQGYDLNYVGIIIGKEIDYNPITDRIEVEKKKYKDQTGKTSTDGEEFRNYILNIYITLFTRGIKGAYVYVCNDRLREYLKQYI